MIGDDVIVTVLSAGGGQTTISVNAPSGVAVYKEEIYKNIKQEQMES